MQGILFVEELYRLTCQGVKTETRRTGAFIKKNKDGKMLDCVNLHPNDWEKPFNLPWVPHFPYLINKNSGETISIKPRYQKGEVLYLKEPYRLDRYYIYKYDLPCDYREEMLEKRFGSGAKFTNKLFMPLRAARVFIRITEWNFERLQDITEGACIKEGIRKQQTHFTNPCNPVIFSDVKECYKDLLMKANKTKNSRIWDENYWVFVYKYELFTPQEKLL